MDTEYDISTNSYYWLGGQFNYDMTYEWEWIDGSACKLFSY